MTHGWYLINSVSLADLEIVFTEVKVLLIPFHWGWFSSEFVFLNNIWRIPYADGLVSCPVT